MYGITFERSTPSRFEVLKKLENITFEKQCRIYEAWKKAQTILNKKHLGITGYYITTYYSPPA